MELLSDLKRLVESRQKELADYVTTYNERMGKDREKLLNEIKEQFQADPESVDLEEVARDTMFMSGFFQTDIRRMQEGLVNAYDIYFELGGENTFDKEVEDTVQFLKTSLPKRKFVVKGGDFEETEKGYVKKMQKQYEEKNLFRMFEGPLRTLLNE